MSLPLELARLVLRQDEGDAADPTPGHCQTTNEYNGRMGVRISSIFAILVASTFGRQNSPRGEE